MFVTTHYMEEAEHCDRIAIINQGGIVALDTPSELKAGIGKDRVQIHHRRQRRRDLGAAARFGLEAAVHEGAVTVAVPDGAGFVPRLFDGLGVPIRSVTVTRPTLDDVFLAHTGSTIRDAEEGGLNNRMIAMASAGGGEQMTATIAAGRAGASAAVSATRSARPSWSGSGR